MRRFPRCVALGLLAGAVGPGLGCGTSDIPVLLVVGGADAGAGADVGADVGVEAQGPVPDAGPPGTLPYCSTTGPPTLVEATDGGSICPDQLAQRAFRYALCLCNNYVSDHALVTDAFDGSNGPYAASTATAGGSVGVNGDLHPQGLLQINGSLWASNSTDITTSTVQVSGELHAQGELHPSPTLVVQADAWMASGIQTSGDVTVAGTLHIPTGEPTDVTGTFNHGPIDGTSFSPLSPACDCTSSDFVDIAGVVATYAAHNDDAALGIQETALENVQSDTSMNLPCGRIFLTRIGAAAPVHLTAQGHVALFVGGDLSTTSDFEIDAPAGSEIDLFVAGIVTVSGVFQVGSPSNPARARTYVGGSTVNLQNAATLAGNLYAPNAGITLGGAAPTTLYGSIFASGLTSGSDLTIHYDEAILTPSSTPACALPSACATCNDCNGGACNSGLCGPCADSSQCCPPLTCNAGACVADVIPR